MDRFSEMADKKGYRGRMNDPHGSAWIKGLCGDTMEYYLVIEKDTLTAVSFETDGCEGTLACGNTVALLAEGKSLKEALALSPAGVIDYIGNLPKEHLHCAILSVMTFHKAIAEYILKP
jgi:nitrogen fixation NifU-like protein